MNHITIEASKTYDVFISHGLLAHVGDYVARVLKPCTICMVSDDGVYPLYGQTVCRSLEKAGFSICNFIFPAGEQSKSMGTLENLLEFMAEKPLTRGDAILALGGGIPGDLAGFAAACYLRGISFIQVPTTLLAAVDSSVGGKTGVNLERGKNLAGAFWQPSLVLCDCATFGTLPQETVLDGIAEMIKYGMILDEELFALLSQKDVAFFTSPQSAGNQEKLENQKALEAVVARCIQLKKTVVMEDERDTGQRQLLNFGHTIGHAIERCSDFQISHGHGVALGMRIAAKGAYAMGFVPADCSDIIEKILLQFGFPLNCPYSAQLLSQAALADKKRVSNEITLILPYGVGDCRLKNIDIKLLEPFIERGLS